MSIELNNVTKKYGTQAVVDQFSLEIEQGEMFVLLGASGSGKSTLLRIIAGLTPLDNGGISLHGRDVTHLPPQQRGVGFVFQNYSLFKHMTAAQNIGFGLEIQRIPRQTREQRITELLSLIDMSELGNRMPWQLSGGQQQRVAVARALAQRPDVLLLDEPFGALDVKIRSQLRQNLRQIQQQLGVTAILVTHDQDEAFELADRIGVIEAGKLLEVGKPNELYSRPRHRFTATFLGSANLFPASRNGSTIHLGEFTLPAPPATEHLSNREVEVILRPEEVEIAHTADDLTGHFLGKGVVESITFAGSAERVQVYLQDWDRTVTALVYLDRARALALRPGDQVWVGIREYHLVPANHA